MALLYSGLDPAAAGEVVAALEQQGVAYDVRTGAILVDSAQRDSLRMTLAAEGLPASNGQGYELLDSLTGFGTTSQMFDAAYWRAKEGELARTITASAQVSAARVHISNQSSNPFQRGLEPSASVTVSAAAGNVSPAQAKAFRYLISSAVAGLTPENVSVIDARNGVVVSGDDTQMASGGNDRADSLKQSIQRLLEARVGPGNAVVEVAVETVTEREALFERR
ncbi:MAG: flagellar M-ring protein FliF, partial [Pseudomonadota bacterium]